MHHHITRYPVLPHQPHPYPQSLSLYPQVPPQSRHANVPLSKQLHQAYSYMSLFTFERKQHCIHITKLIIIEYEYTIVLCLTHILYMVFIHNRCTPTYMFSLVYCPPFKSEHILVKGVHIRNIYSNISEIYSRLHARNVNLKGASWQARPSCSISD